MIFVFLLLLLTGNTQPLMAENPPRGYYKDVFMDSGVGLTSRKVLPVEKVLGLSGELYLTQEDSDRQNALIGGNETDENGILLYPDGQPRFRMVFMNGGKASRHLGSLSDKAADAFRQFVRAGGSYLGCCAGAYLGSVKYLGLWPGRARFTGLNKSWTAMAFEPGSVLSLDARFGGKMQIDSVRHNGGCFAQMEDAPEGTEILARYAMQGRLPELGLDGLPSLWAYKASERCGRVILCGSHPEGAATGENLALMSALVRYALEGCGEPVLKGELVPGEPRRMTAGSADRNPAFTCIGDRQYHHFRIPVPEGTKAVEIRLEGVEGRKNFDLYLAASPEGFAFLSDAPWCNVQPGTDKTLTVERPAAGALWISVYCATTVTHRQGEEGLEYSGRTDVLNGVPYILTARLL